MIGESGANLKARVATQDKRMAKLEGKMLQSSSDRDSSVSSQVSVCFVFLLRHNSVCLSLHENSPVRCPWLEENVSG